MKTRVLVYDDNKGRQEALQMLLNDTEDMQCIGVFENCSHVIDDVNTTMPDIVLMDIDMPKVNGIEGLKLIRHHAPHILILMQTVFEDDEKIFSAIRAGAHGYFLKKTPSAKLIEGIRDALEGGAPMSASIARKVYETFQQQPSGKNAQRFDLTEREQHILSLLMKGMSYKMIAEACNITFNTVNGHCKKIYEKLHVHSATEAVAKAIEQKIV
jgi:DNA-binding NarL/FixJ family response regulator